MSWISRSATSIYLVIFIAGLLVACTNNQAQAKAIVAEIKQQYGLNVHHLRDTSQLPSSVVFKIKDGEATVKVKPLSHGQFLNYIKILQKALAKYPQSLIKQSLSDVYIGGPYTENDAIIVGMYTKNKIYLFYNHHNGNNHDVFLEQTFHHEYSSILVKKYNFPAFDWLKLNPKGFSYIINPKKIDKYMNSIGKYAATKEMLKQGVVTSYGMVNAENDINTYVETIFTQPNKMKKYISTYPVIARKYQMLKKFYLSISPQFGEVFDLIG